MSEENVEQAREATRRFEAGDWEGYSALLHPEVRITAAEGWPEKGPIVGRDAVVAQYRRVMAEWVEARVTDIEIVAAEGDWVVVETRFYARGAASGIETNFGMATATRIQDTQITETHWRWSREEALEAAGLSE